MFAIQSKQEENKSQPCHNPLYCRQFVDLFLASVRHTEVGLLESAPDRVHLLLEVRRSYRLFGVWHLLGLEAPLQLMLMFPGITDHHVLVDDRTPYIYLNL